MSAHIEHLSLYAKRWQEAPHGQKEMVVSQVASVFGISKQTAYRKLKSLVATPTRKRRSDCGRSAVTYDELIKISAAAAEHTRKNGKMILPLNQNIERLRANGLINASRVDEETGEVLPLSASAINRALKRHSLHPTQLSQPAPAVRMRSNHPNHIWQIDPSRCVMAYLPDDDTGLQPMDEKEFYKNKPKNQIKAINHALWRYVIVDHASGWIYVEYVLGGETAENITNVLINAMVEREGEAFHGVPQMIMLDAGSANTSAIFKNLCQSLRIKLQINKPGNPRAKGAVEKGNDIVERHFESVLKTLPSHKVKTLAQINGLAKKWRQYFNASERLIRHGMTRTQAWLKIRSEELVIAPPADVLRELAVTAPESRVVSTFLTVSYKGREYDVSDVPGVLVGERLLICRNPTRELSMQAIVTDVNGHEVHYVLPEIKKDEWGFDATAPVIGESYSSKGDTLASANLKKLELIATGSETLEEAQQIRKAQSKGRNKGLFNGAYNPLAAIEQTEVIPHLPRRGVEHELTKQKVVMPLMNIMQVAKALRIELGEWEPRYYGWLQENYPDGIREDEVSRVATELKEAMSKSNVLQFRRAV